MNTLGIMFALCFLAPIFNKLVEYALDLQKVCISIAYT